MLTPTRPAPSATRLSALRTSPLASYDFKANTDSLSLHVVGVQGQDPHPQQHSEQHQDKSTYDYNGSKYVPYIEEDTNIWADDDNESR